MLDSVSALAVLERAAKATPSMLVFERGDYNLNVITARKIPGTVDAFDDDHYLIYKVGGVWRGFTCKVSADPGLSGLIDPVNPKGTAVLCPGQTRGSHKIGLHHGTFALVQNAPLRCWRERDRNGVIDYAGPVFTDARGCNYHRARPNGLTSRVGPWSLGCVVHADSREPFTHWQNILHEAAIRYGDVFSTTIYHTSAQ